jgi:hypothetical protein
MILGKRQDPELASLWEEILNSLPEQTEKQMEEKP